MSLKNMENKNTTQFVIAVAAKNPNEDAFILA